MELFFFCFLKTHAHIQIIALQHGWVSSVRGAPGANPEFWPVPRNVSCLWPKDKPLLLGAGPKSCPKKSVWTNHWNMYEARLLSNRFQSLVWFHTQPSVHKWDFLDISSQHNNSLTKQGQADFYLWPSISRQISSDGYKKREKVISKLLSSECFFSSFHGLLNEEPKFHEEPSPESPVNKRKLLFCYFPF